MKKLKIVFLFSICAILVVLFITPDQPREVLGNPPSDYLYHGCDSSGVHAPDIEKVRTHVILIAGHMSIKTFIETAEHVLNPQNWILQS